MANWLRRLRPRKTDGQKIKEYVRKHRSQRESTRYYEAAATDRHLEKTWTYATETDADAALVDYLPTLRNRCRYEMRNNSYCRGIAETLANDIVGSGPKIQFTTESEAFNKEAEEKFRRWSAGCDRTGRMDLAELLRLCVLQFCECGESLIADQIDGNEYQLLMIEPDRLATPWQYVNSDDVRSGVQVDASGKPLKYWICKHHPGSQYDMNRLEDYQAVDAANLTHLFRQDRPGQNRGAPWLAPSLVSLNKLKRYTEAVIAAAETAASITFTIEGDPAIATGDADDDFDTIDIEKNTGMFLPAGHKAQQMKAEQPTAAYQAFKHEILNEIARPLHMPFNVAALNSSSYNYASGRLDWQVYYKYLTTIRAWLEARLLRHVVNTWFRLARLQYKYFSVTPFLGAGEELSFTWFWPGTEHVDPAKEATATQIKLDSLTTNLAAEYARQGKDWEEELEQIAREAAKIEELGLKPKPQPQPAEKPQAADPEAEDEPKTDAEEAVA